MSERPVLVHRVIARLNVGGPALHVVHLSEAMNEGGWRTRLIAGRTEEREGDMGYYAEARGVRVRYVAALARSIHPWDDLATLWRLYRVFREERPDVVHTHTAKAGTLGRLAALLAGVPVRIHTFHGHVLGGRYFAPWKTRFFLEIERHLARATHRLIVLTEAQAREMSAALAVAPRDRFAVVPLGLDLEPFTAVDRLRAGPEARLEVGAAPGELVLGIVGRLVPIKNHELFLEILALLATQGPSVRGVVVGSGEREEALRAHARHLGIEDRISWMGWRRDLERLYPAMDVVALTSRDEGTPVGLLEALTAGIPVAARTVGGVPEVLEQGALGELIEVDDPAAVAAAIARVAGRTVDDRARDRLVSRFSAERLCSDLAQLYREELERAGVA